MFDNLFNWWGKNKFYLMILGSILFIALIFLIKKLSKSYYIKTAKNLNYVKNMYTKYSNPKLEDIFNLDKYGIKIDQLYNNSLDDLPLKKRRMMPTVSKGEMRCRTYLENKFGRQFDKIRPEILKNKVTGHNLEIDCYNNELNLGIEYNGQQHYKYCKGVHRNYEHFQTQRYRDEIKKHLCKEAGIVLIEVPYWVKDIETFLEQRIIELGYDKYFLVNTVSNTLTANNNQEGEDEEDIEEDIEEEKEE
jgi:hypothetical protein